MRLMGVQDGGSALICAAHDGHCEVVKALIEANASIDLQGQNGNSALICAALDGHLSCVTALLEAHHPDCHARLCLKAGTRVPSNEALAAAVSRVLARKVRNEQVTLPGQVKARAPILGLRKVCGRPQRYPRLPRGFAPWGRLVTPLVQHTTR